MIGLMIEETYMRQALKLAAKGWGRTSPNPMVGAVLVKGRRIVGKGFHEGPGLAHAEVVAIRNAGAKARGSTLYTNLEPCNHTAKRTPPCCRELIRQKIAKVVLAMRDPNPLVNGKGVRLLRRSGIRVEEGMLKAQALQLNEAYGKFITQGRPFVLLKVAQSLDGKIATAKGESQWMTSERARAYVHRLRAGTDAVMVGIGTLLQDDPQLTVRTTRSGLGRQPVRVVVDSRLRLPPNARIMEKRAEGRVLVATTSLASPTRIRGLEAKGVEVLVVKERQGRVSLSSLMERLGLMGFMSVMIEGGAALNASALREGVVDKLLFFVAPRVMGGQDALSAVGGDSPHRLSEMVKLDRLKVKRLGPDILLEGYTI